MDSNVKTLIDATNCTETEAQQVLDEAGGDVSKALKLLDAVSKEIMVFQAAFQVPGKKESAGFACAMFDTSSNDVVFTDFLYPLDESKSRMLDVNMPPTVFVSTLKNLRGGMSERNQGTSRSNARQLSSKFSSNFIQTVTSMWNRGQKDTAVERFSKAISGILGEDVELKLNASAQSMDALFSILSGNGKNRSSRPEEKAAKLFGDGEPEHPGGPLHDLDDLPSASPQEELPRITLICEPEISPFEGKAARELQEGDEVIVKIKDGREAARYFAELLGGIVNDELVPLCVPIIKISSVSETFVEAYVEFGPGIYGQFFIPPDVRVKMGDEDNIEIYDPFQNEESLFADSRMGRKIILELGVLIVAAIVLIAIFWNLGFS